MMMIKMMMMRMSVVWLTLSQPGPQPDHPLDPPGKDAAPHTLHHHDDDKPIQQ